MLPAKVASRILRDAKPGKEDAARMATNSCGPRALQWEKSIAAR
jgi:hypothetical protein